jgi:hypothetical protein
MVERAGPPIQPFFSLSNVLPENSPAGKRAMANSQCIYLLVIINVKHKKTETHFFFVAVFFFICQQNFDSISFFELSNSILGNKSECSTIIAASNAEN